MNDLLVPEERPASEAGPRNQPSLEYTPRYGAGGPVTVRGLRLVVALLLVNTVLLGMSVLGPQLFPFLRAQWTQWRAERAAKKAEEQARQAALALRQQCLGHVMPAGQVVYDEDPVEATKRLADPAAAYVPAPTGSTRDAPPGWAPPATAAIPTYFPTYADVIYSGRVAGVTDPLLFLHGRTSARGELHVVSVNLTVRSSFERRIDQATGATRFVQVKQRSLTARAWPAGPGGPRAATGKHKQTHAELALPDSTMREIARVQGSLSIDQAPPIDYGNVVRFWAGQPDPADASHFTIPYDVDGRAGVIDGWLRDDGLRLRPREGDWAFTSGGEAWKLPSGPTARPKPSPTN